MACQCQSSPLLFARKETSGRFGVFTGLSLLGGLLSSSCCVIQLLLNSLQLGCAGFAILTPWQAHFRTLTVLALAHLIYREGLSRRSTLTVALTAGLMFSQDVVRGYNLYAGSSALPVPVSKGPRPDGEKLPKQNQQAAHATVTKPALSWTAPSHDTAASSAENAQVSSSASLDTRSSSDQDNAPRVPVIPTNATSKSSSLRSNSSPAKSDAPLREGAAASTGGPHASASDALAAAAAARSDALAAAAARAVYMRFEVEGIKCEGCAARLKAALMRLEGVQRCVVDFASRQVLLWAAPGAVTVAEVRAAIQFVDLSYRATLVESSGL